MNQPEVAAQPVREGDILAGKYRVERVLGVGGMGMVVAATHLQLDQRVALKFVLPDAVKNAEAVERFAREARAAAKLRSEHVARVIDVATLDNGAPYMVMEYLEGRDLGQEVDARGGLGFEEAADYVLQACEAIAEAHGVGIIHRDLKPQNMFLTRRVDGRPLVKVLDFGISKFNGSTSGENMSLTKTHAVMGSPNYMSPEQLRSARGVDARSDIWALGVIMYELLTGRVPFVATSVTELCAMVLQDAPRPLREVRPDVPESLAEVVYHCLEKDPANRFQSIASLAHALEPFTRGNRAHSGAAQRILAVARESSARGLGGNTPNPNYGPNQGNVPPALMSASASGQVPAAAGSAPPGKTSVSWAATELAKPVKRSRAPMVVLSGICGLILFAAAAGLTWRLVSPRLHHASASPSTSATVPAPPPAVDIPPAQPETTAMKPAAPPPTSSAPPISPVMTTALPVRPGPSNPSPDTVSTHPGTHPQHGPVPIQKPAGRRNTDQEAPDERN